MLRRFTPLTLLLALVALVAAPLRLHAAPPAPVHAVAAPAPHDSAPAVPLYVDSLPAIDSLHVAAPPSARSDSMVRAKFRVVEHRENAWFKGQKTIVFEAVYDQSVPEDQRYASATPSGRIEMQVNNPAAIAVFELGRSFYLDFTPTDS